MHVGRACGGCVSDLLVGAAGSNKVGMFCLKFGAHARIAGLTSFGMTNLMNELLTDLQHDLAVILAFLH
jgi:hypothetical protein